MTREEFRDYIDEQRTLNNIPYHVYSTLIDGIDTLEQEHCDDAISRRDAIKKFTYNYKGERIPEYDCDNYPVQIDIKTVKQMLRELPPVKPQETKTGHWILTDVEENRIWHCNCSECGKDPQDYIGGSENWWLIKGNLPKYCPTCGAKFPESEDKE